MNDKNTNNNNILYNSNYYWTFRTLNEYQIYKID